MCAYLTRPRTSAVRDVDSNVDVSIYMGFHIILITQPQMRAEQKKLQQEIGSVQAALCTEALWLGAMVMSSRKELFAMGILAGDVSKLVCTYDCKDHWWHSGITYKESFCHLSLALRLAHHQGYAASVMRAGRILPPWRDPF